jgi:hypothetical protein
MRNMVERGLLESAQGRGFRLAPSRATTEAAEEATGTYHTEAQP